VKLPDKRAAHASIIACAFIAIVSVRRKTFNSLVEPMVCASHSVMSDPITSWLTKV